MKCLFPRMILLLSSVLSLFGLPELRQPIADVNGFQWVLVSGGAYSYGKAGQTRADITYDFYIMKHEVTNAQYSSFLNEALKSGQVRIAANGDVIGYFAGDKHWNAGNRLLIDIQDSDCRISWNQQSFISQTGFEQHPVVEVSWFGANAFAEFYGLRLPTEYAWEKAARANSGDPFPWGMDALDCDYANFFGCEDGTSVVGTHSGDSPYGVSDMAGNVAEWTRSYFQKGSAVKVVRGGAWNSFGGGLTSFHREYENPPESTKAIGFRCITLNPRTN